MNLDEIKSPLPPRKVIVDTPQSTTVEEQPLDIPKERLVESGDWKLHIQKRHVSPTMN